MVFSVPMAPPPAEPFASRLLLGPALRAQPDRRLVKLVREGYENAFEEIDRRYRKPLERFAASFVGARSEDVTQDAFSKALLALRGSENEIELRPWLYRIVRNTALNEIRDRPPSVEQLEETLEGGQSAAVEFERREEMSELMERLRALPEPRRAAIVMRELEGLSHEEIAAALGVSGGAARQAIHRARTSLRNGLGLLVPLPLLRLLFDHGAEVSGAAAASATGGAAVASAGGLGAGAALKVGVAAVLVAGSVGAGVAVEQNHHGKGDSRPAAAQVSDDSGSDSSESGGSGGSSGSGEPEPGDDRGGESGPGGDDGGARGGGDGRGGGSGSDDNRNGDGGGGSGGGPGPSGSSGSSGSDDSGSSGRGGSSGSSGGDGGGSGGRSGPGGGGSPDGSGGGSDDGLSGGSGSGSGGGSSGGSSGGSDGGSSATSGGGSGSSSGGSGSGDSSHSGSDDSELPPPSP
jgi:RNA polymerase sigma factor (sigma-70 family)